MDLFDFDFKIDSSDEDFIDLRSKASHFKVSPDRIIYKQNENDIESIRLMKKSRKYSSTGILSFNEQNLFFYRFQ